MIALLLIIGVGLYAYKEYNRKNINISDTKAAFVMTEMQLIKEFSQDQSASNKMYSGKL